VETLTQLDEIRQKLGSVELVAVSKTKPVAQMLELYRQGQRIFGENYVQELVEKKNQFDLLGIKDIEFHFIGHLQSNKVKSMLPCVSTIHSIDSVRLYEEVIKRAEEMKLKISVYFQINIDDEKSKSGFRSSEVTDLAYLVKTRTSPSVRVIGLMTIPSPEGIPGAAFRKMHELSKRYRSELGSGLSMGMSNDYEMAIAEGATSVRIGSALFGKRDP